MHPYRPCLPYLNLLASPCARMGSLLQIAVYAISITDRGCCFHNSKGLFVSVLYLDEKSPLTFDFPTQLPVPFSL